MKRTWIGVAVALAAIGSPVTIADGAADDQARLDEVIAEFEARMTDAGWESQGPSDDESDEDDEDEPESSEPADEMVGDDEFDECFGDLAVLLGDDLESEELPGQTAASESDEFTYAPEGGASVTTEEFSLDFDEETAAAFAASVDDASVSTVTQVVDAFGSKETGDCMRRALEAEMAADSEESDVPIEFETSISNEADLGIGDNSAALSFGFSTVFMVPITVDVQILMAQSGNDIVMVLYGVTGEAASGFDPHAELQLLVDSLAA